MVVLVRGREEELVFCGAAPLSVPREEGTSSTEETELFFFFCGCWCGGWSLSTATCVLGTKGPPCFPFAIPDVGRGRSPPSSSAAPGATRSLGGRLWGVLEGGAARSPPMDGPGPQEATAAVEGDTVVVVVGSVEDGGGINVCRVEGEAGPVAAAGRGRGAVDSVGSIVGVLGDDTIGEPGEEEDDRPVVDTSLFLLPFLFFPSIILPSVPFPSSRPLVSTEEESECSTSTGGSSGRDNFIKGDAAAGIAPPRWLPVMGSGVYFPFFFISSPSSPRAFLRGEVMPGAGAEEEEGGACMVVGLFSSSFPSVPPTAPLR